MAIFNEISKKISKTTQEAVKGTKDLADITRLSNLISEEQRAINNVYAQIGEKYYELFTAPTEEPFMSFCSSISEHMMKIKEHEVAIQSIKGIRKCTGCGAEIPKTAVFCGVCGYASPIEPDIASEKSVCSNCGKELSAGMVFCTDCGQKL